MIVMTLYSIPSTLLSQNEDGAFVEITKDERQPFGSIDIKMNEAGLDRFAGLADEYQCNGLTLAYQHYGQTSKGSSEHCFKPGLAKILDPAQIQALTIGSVGNFARDFDFSMFEKFKNVKALTLESIPIIDKIDKFFPDIEVVRIFDWPKNKISFRKGLWPKLRCLHLINFRGDLSTLSEWKIEVLFLHHGKPISFSSLRLFSKLRTFAAEGLNSDIDLSVLSDLPYLRHLSLRKPRQSVKMFGYTSHSLEMMIIDRADPAALDNFNIERDFPCLRFYAIDFGKKREFMQWDGFRQYGDPFASVDFIRPYPPQ